MSSAWAMNPSQSFDAEKRHKNAVDFLYKASGNRVKRVCAFVLMTVFFCYHAGSKHLKIVDSNNVFAIEILPMNFGTHYLWIRQFEIIFSNSPCIIF